MAGGLNKAFMTNPDAFVQRHPFDIYPFLGEGSSGGVQPLSIAAGEDDHVTAGAKNFDLVEDARGLVRLTLYDGQRRRHSHRIRAYWLPWNPKGEAHVAFSTLADQDLDYIFTSSLAGCRILVTKTHFYHISGQLSQAERGELADDLRKGRRARAFSSTTGTTYGDGAFIVGYRVPDGQHARQSGGWNFIAQASTRDGPTTGFRVTNIWQNNDFILIK